MTTLDRDDRRWQGFWGLALDVISKVINLPRTKIWLFPTPRPNELLCNCTRVIGADGLYERDFTEAEIEGRRQVRGYARFFRDNLAGCEHSLRQRHGRAGRGALDASS